MLELRLSCEHCDMPLPNDSDEAMICTCECTFCREYVEEILHNVCPNCGGGFERRPTRPHAQLASRPPCQDKVHKPVDMDAFVELLGKNRHVNPRQR